MSGNEFNNPEIAAQSTKALTNWLEKTGTQNWKLAKDTFEQIGKVKKEQWSEMKGTFGEITNIIDQGGFAGLLGGSIDRLKSQIENSLSAGFAPLTNIIAQSLNAIFDLPAVQNIIGGITTLFHRGMMLLTGDFEGLTQELRRHQAEVERIRQATGASAYELARARAALEMAGFDVDALNASGTAGGLYSGQYVIDAATVSHEIQNEISSLNINIDVTW